jgi:hypothetical protein
MGSFWRRIFSGNISDGVKVSNAWIHARCNHHFGDAKVHCLDEFYLLRPKTPTKALAGIVDLDYKIPFPDCNTFARIAHGRVLDLCVEKRYRYGPVFGTIILKLHGMESEHMMNVAFFKGGEVELFEPQNGRWLGMDDVDYVRRVDF